MQLEEVQYYILQSGQEGYTYLYEVQWGMNLFKEITTEERQQIAKEAVLQLLDEKFIRFYWCDEPWDDNDLIEMTDASEIRRSVEHQSSWEAPPKRGNVRYITTEKGILLLEKLIAQGFYKRFWIL